MDEVSVSYSLLAFANFSDLYSLFASLIDSLWESMFQVVSFMRESARWDVPLWEVVELGARDSVGSGSASPQDLIGSLDSPLRSDWFSWEAQYVGAWKSSLRKELLIASSKGE